MSWELSVSWYTVSTWNVVWQISSYANEWLNNNVWPVSSILVYRASNISIVRNLLMKHLVLLSCHTENYVTIKLIVLISISVEKKINIVMYFFFQINCESFKLSLFKIFEQSSLDSIIKLICCLCSFFTSWSLWLRDKKSILITIIRLNHLCNRNWDRRTHSSIHLHFMKLEPDDSKFKCIAWLHHSREQY